ncbi:helix-turn-helix transcriptional regulator [Flagellimonas sp. 389]|uniref:helix-turn-helix domain-containing protein n=1 Tax=Flagellimonas sp. 389 TaxID=2835862 RepID=UPI001BD25BC9|nr:AraC family transcriptional regulator [Flagellimonas sp. 389]MBS9462908.1 helix-turn-helix transcriptional regulator [Flagellimonas sp. 389]
MNVFEFPKQDSIDRLRNVVESPLKEIEWPNVVVTASYKNYQKSISESSFTILANTSGTIKLSTSKRNIKVCEQTFYISNPFESFRYEIDSEDLVDTFNIHINFDFYTKAQYALLNSNEKLLDIPYEQDSSYKYINQLHYRNSSFNEIIQSYSTENEASFLMDILKHSLVIDHKEKGRSFNIHATKKSTRKELAKRMVEAKDYIYSNYNDSEFSMKNVSRLVSMSHFHFLRVFKNVYGISPHQYLKRIRIERAKYLLNKTDLPINAIAYAVGFKESTTIYPILKNHLSTTPQKYRKKFSNFQKS